MSEEGVSLLVLPVQLNRVWPEWHLLKATQVKRPSCQRKLASRVGLSADDIQTLDSGFRRNDDLIRGLFPK